MKTAGEIIKEARLKNNLTQLELSKKSGLTPNTIARIERDIQKPTFSSIKKLSRALEIDITRFPG